MGWTGLIRGLRVLKEGFRNQDSCGKKRTTYKRKQRYKNYIKLWHDDLLKVGQCCCCKKKRFCSKDHLVIKWQFVVTAKERFCSEGPFGSLRWQFVVTAKERFCSKDHWVIKMAACCYCKGAFLLRGTIGSLRWQLVVTAKERCCSKDHWVSTMAVCCYCKGTFLLRRAIGPLSWQFVVTAKKRFCSKDHCVIKMAKNGTCTHVSGPFVGQVVAQAGLRVMAWQLVIMMYPAGLPFGVRLSCYGACAHFRGPFVGKVSLKRACGSWLGNLFYNVPFWVTFWVFAIVVMELAFIFRGPFVGKVVGQAGLRVMAKGTFLLQMDHWVIMLAVCCYGTWGRFCPKWTIESLWWQFVYCTWERFRSKWTIGS